MSNKHVNAVIVGAGAGGGVVAKELSEAGLSVVLIERGGWASFDDHDRDELLSQRTTCSAMPLDRTMKGTGELSSMMTVRQKLFMRVTMTTITLQPVLDPVR